MELQKIKCLTIFTDVKHHYSRVKQTRGWVIDQVLSTLLSQLHEYYPVLFQEVSIDDIKQAVYHKADKIKDIDKRDSSIDITRLLYECYPEFEYFHNHHPETGKRKHQYPLVQYRCYKGRLIIHAYGEVIPLIEHWLLRSESRISHRTVQIRHELQDIGVMDKYLHYRMYDWIPLSNDDYHKWREHYLMRDRLKLLEQKLKAYLYYSCDTFGCQLHEADVKSDIILINEVKQIKSYHDATGFNILYRTNVQLPDRFALGRGSSLGFGTTRMSQWQGETDPKDSEKRVKQGVQENIFS